MSFQRLQHKCGTIIIYFVVHVDAVVLLALEFPSIFFLN